MGVSRGKNLEAGEHAEEEPGYSRQKRKNKAAKHVPSAGSKPEPGAQCDLHERTSKKVKRASRAAEHELTEPHADPQDPVAHLPQCTAKSNGKAKKDKKGKQQKRPAEPTAAQPVPAAREPGSEPSQQLAAVGDQNLAQSSPPIVKAMYKQHAAVAKRTDEEVAAFRAERNISIEGADIRPVTDFKHLGMKARLLHAVKDFQRPSPVQAQCWPVVLSGMDLIGIASTGSGKTLAFGLPALKHVRQQRRSGVCPQGHPCVLVMAPTRELAQQISEVLEAAGSECEVAAGCLYGGVDRRTQQRMLRSGLDIVVGTPGRVRDLLEDGALKLDKATYLVLDEADRMLDLGFEPEIRKIASYVRADRQTLMFSATWPPVIQRLAMDFLVCPVRVTVGSKDLAASHSVQQRVEVVEDHERGPRLLEVLRKHGKKQSGRVLIFVLYKKEAPHVQHLLRKNGWTAAAVHGDVGQQARNEAVAQFKSAAVRLLIATDVAARGLDIPDVELVINYSFPLTVEDYVHRIGRTGRAGKSGLSHTFFVAKNDKAKAGELMNVLQEAKQEVPQELLAFGSSVKKKQSSLYGAHFRDVDLTAKPKRIVF